MRVGILVHRLNGGGAENVAAAWAQGLAARGHDVLAMTYGGAHFGARLQGCQTVAFPEAGARDRVVTLPRWVSRTCEETSREVVVGVLTYSNLVLLTARLRRRGTATVLTEHNMLPDLLRTQGRGGRAQDLLAQASYRRADAVVACSHAVAAGLSSHYSVDPSRLWVVPNPVEQTQRPARGPAPSPRLTFVGRLEAAKSPRVLLDTLVALRSGGHSMIGRYVGSGSMEPELRAFANAVGLDVEFTGWLSDWTSTVAQGDVLLLPSRTEGFGNVLIEAAAAGIPAVAPSQALGVGDGIIDGLTGVLALSSRPVDLATAVERARALAPAHQDSVRAWAARWSPANSAGVLERVLTAAVSGQ